MKITKIVLHPIDTTIGGKFYQHFTATVVANRKRHTATGFIRIDYSDGSG